MLDLPLPYPSPPYNPEEDVPDRLKRTTVGKVSTSPFYFSYPPNPQKQSIHLSLDP